MREKPMVITLLGNRGGWRLALQQMPNNIFCAVLATQNNIGPANVMRSGHFPRAAVMEIYGDEVQEPGADACGEPPSD